MARGRVYTQDEKAHALRLHVEGAKLSEISAQLGIPPRTVAGWLDQYKPLAVADGPLQYQQTREELSGLVYAAIVETIQAIRARAQATADRAWILGQQADTLAELDATQWQFVIRVLGAYKPPDDADGEPEPPGADTHRNGAVDTPG